MFGRTIRLRRLFRDPSRRLFAVPLDHSVSMGPIPGLEQVAPLAEALQAGGVDLLIVTKGAVREIAPVLRPDCLLGVHLSASTGLSPRPDSKVLAGSAEEAIALGADLVSVQVNFGTSEEGNMLRDLGVAADQCRGLGLPLLCMAYVKRSDPATPEEIGHAARASADLGADIVKTSYPGSLEGFRRLVRSTPVPVLIGGGLRSEDPARFLVQVREAVSAGAGGICIGRNLFQREPLEPLVREVAEILHGPPTRP